MFTLFDNYYNNNNAIKILYGKNIEFAMLQLSYL